MPYWLCSEKNACYSYRIDEPLLLWYNHCNSISAFRFGNHSIRVHTVSVSALRLLALFLFSALDGVKYNHAAMPLKGVVNYVHDTVRHGGHRFQGI